MYPLYVITELRTLLPQERWIKLVAPMQEQLIWSGLGRVVDFEVLQQATEELGYCPAEEIAVELVNDAYGRDLVKDVLSDAGISPGRPVQPIRWRDYHCDEYFSADLATLGHYDELSQFWIIRPFSSVYEDRENQFLVLGGPGVDGIKFGFRHGHSGLWAYYPIGGEFKLKAQTIAELVEGWCSGELSV
jgi:hypothetical protein